MNWWRRLIGTSKPKGERVDVFGTSQKPTMLQRLTNYVRFAQSKANHAWYFADKKIQQIVYRKKVESTVHVPFMVSISLTNQLLTLVFSC